MREKWYICNKKADFNAWAKEFHISPVLARLIRNRDVTSSEEVDKYLNGTLKDCYSPWLLHDMDRAVDVILEKIGENAHIRVMGDYDVDGICSSYIMTKGLRLLGADADTVIPHRIHDGFGLNDRLIDEAREDGVDLIITCDNGIAAAEQVARAKSYGMSVVVTDHHEVPFETGKDNAAGLIREEILPPADAVVDPAQASCHYPFKQICGSMVAYKVMQALAGRTEDEKLADAMDEFVEFAALGTVCDVMDLKDENRIIAKEGIKRMHNSRNEGLKALIEVNGLDPKDIGAWHLGFVIGPCLNATGRLDSAMRALELLESTSWREAVSIASSLKELNDSRKDMTAKGVDEAETYIEERGLVRDTVLVVYLPDVHESLAGIIAGKIRERYYRPVFVLTRGEEGIKGSGRSIEGYHMFEHLTQVGELMTKFGGHRLAAGLTLDTSSLTDTGNDREAEEEIVANFRRKLNENANLGEDDLIPKVHIDIAMPLSAGSMELARELSLLEPVGTGNPQPLFAWKDLLFLHGRIMGAGKNAARFTVRTPEGSEHELVFFDGVEQFDSFLDEKYGPGSSKRLYEGRAGFNVSVTYQLQINNWRGEESVQFVMKNYC